MEQIDPFEADYLSRNLEFWRSNILTFAPQSDRVYHYTDAAGLLGIVECQELWLSNTLFLNDSRELAYGFDRIVEALHRRTGDAPHLCRAALRHFEQPSAGEEPPDEPRLPNDVYVASFSEAGDSLSLWRSYSQQASGYALGFSVPKLLETIAPNNAEAVESRSTPVYQTAAVIYEEREQVRVINEIIDMSAAQEQRLLTDGDAAQKHNAALNLSGTLRFMMPLLKDPGFADEREVRMTLQITPGMKPEYRVRGGMPFPFFRRTFPMPQLLEIVRVGPTADFDQASRALTMFLADMEFDNTAVLGSSLPYRGSLAV